MLCQKGPLSNPDLTLTWAAMFACVHCSINSCLCEDTHGNPFCLLYVCRIRLCAMDYKASALLSNMFGAPCSHVVSDVACVHMF